MCNKMHGIQDVHNAKESKIKIRVDWVIKVTL